MNLIDFMKSAGEKIFGVLTPGNAQADTQANVQATFKEHLKTVGLGNPDIQTELQGSTVIVTGNVASHEEREKILLALGNVAGIDKVDDQLTVSASASPDLQSRFVTVESGDTLSKIAKRVYGDPNQYQKIFEANKPMLSHPDKIYPGQVLRIPD